MSAFAGRVAIVTGASRGIGLTVARMLADEGAHVVLVARDPVRLAQVAAGWKGECAVVSGDAALDTTAQAAVATARERFGRLDVLCNVAGWYPTARVAETSDADFAETIASNLGATFVMARAALAELDLAGGTIVNVSSTAARFPTPGLAAYGAAKAGVEAFTRALAAEAAPRVRVNAVSAGPTLTETVRELMATDTTGAVRAVTENLPLRRLAEPEEIAEAIVFLASRRSSAITGQVLHANCGGYMA